MNGMLQYNSVKKVFLLFNNSIWCYKWLSIEMLMVI